MNTTILPMAYRRFRHSVRRSALAEGPRGGVLQRDGALKAGRTAPTGLRQSAQRCHDEGGATLGGESQTQSTPQGLNHCAWNGDATRVGVKIFLGTVDPG